MNRINGSNNCLLLMDAKVEPHSPVAPPNCSPAAWPAAFTGPPPLPPPLLPQLLPGTYIRPNVTFSLTVVPYTLQDDDTIIARTVCMCLSPLFDFDSVFRWVARSFDQGSFVCTSYAVDFSFICKWVAELQCKLPIRLHWEHWKPDKILFTTVTFICFYKLI